MTAHTEKESIPDLDIEFEADGTVMLQQGWDEPQRIQLHELHVRHIAERLGITETVDPAAARTIAKLTRHLCLLRDKIHYLDSYLTFFTDDRHCDLSYERVKAEEIAELAFEFCLELPGATPLPDWTYCGPKDEPKPEKTQPEPKPNPPQTQAKPKSDAVQRDATPGNAQQQSLIGE